MLLLTAELQLLSYGSEPAYERARMHTRTHPHTHTKPQLLYQVSSLELS